MQTYDLLIKNACIYTMDEKQTVIQHGVIGVAGENITLLEEIDTNKTYEGKEMIDVAGSVVFPGFIDAHIHIFQSFLKGLGADHRLIEWLNLSALPCDQYMTPRQHELATQPACMEALKILLYQSRFCIGTFLY